MVYNLNHVHTNILQTKNKQHMAAYKNSIYELIP